MPIRITGLNSGLDTEAIISALVSSYNYKTNKYKKHRPSFPGSRMRGRRSIPRFTACIPAWVISSFPAPTI